MKEPTQQERARVKEVLHDAVEQHRRASEIEQAIADMEEMQETHRKWAHHFWIYPEDEAKYAETVDGRERQLEILEKYDRVIYLLRHAHYSEVLRIIEGATRGDIRKVQSYANLLADKLEADGDKTTAQRIRKVAAGDAGAQIIPLTAGAKS